MLDILAQMYPDAVVYTLFCDRKRLSPTLQRMKIEVSFLHYVPGIRHFYRWLLPILPWVIKTMPVRDADLVISVSHCVAKAVPVPPGAFHLCYCNAPMRYAWGFEEDYFDRFPGVLKFFIKRLLARLRRWDAAECRGVDHFIGNSQNISRRIRDFYGRDSESIYPPVDLEFYAPALQNPSAPGDFYLVVAPFVPYKKTDLVIEAFNRLERRLIVVGSGPLEKHYRSLRRSDKISFLGALPDTELRKLYREARALIYPQEEDFGIIAIEAQGCGAPVIAYGKGGAIETVKTGIFFDAQTPEALCQAVERFEQMTFDRAAAPGKVACFDTARFKREIERTVARVRFEAQQAVGNERD